MGVCTDFSDVPGSLAGVELDLPIGKNDGDAWRAETSVELEHMINMLCLLTHSAVQERDGVRYFSCQPGRAKKPEKW